MICTEVEIAWQFLGDKIEPEALTKSQIENNVNKNLVMVPISRRYSLIFQYPYFGDLKNISIGIATLKYVYENSSFAFSFSLYV